MSRVLIPRRDIPINEVRFPSIDMLVASAGDMTRKEFMKYVERAYFKAILDANPNITQANVGVIAGISLREANYRLNVLGLV